MEFGSATIGTVVWIVGAALVALKDTLLPLFGLPTEGSFVMGYYAVAAVIFLAGIALTVFGTVKKR